MAKIDEENRMAKLFVLACFDKETGRFVEYVRKGRNNSITGYDNLDSAKRGLSQSKRTPRGREYDVEIVKAYEVTIIDENGY